VEPIQLAAVLAAVVVLASVVSVELGVTVALVELTLGVLVGNLFDLRSQEWLDFLAAFGSIVLTFLAGMEVDPAYMRRRLGASRRDRRRLLRGAVHRRLGRRLLRARLVRERLPDRRDGTLDHLAGGRLRGPR
jgi:hypothetical protein